MTTAVQRRRGTNTEHASFTGLEGEISVNTTNESVHVHDGSTAGGFELMRADGANSTVTLGDISGVTAGTGLSGGGTTGTVTLDIDGTVATLAGTQTFTNKTLTSPILNTPTIGTSFTIGGATITEAELEILDGATVTTTELNYVDGVTSAIQTQIDAKAPLASPSFTGNVSVGGTVDGRDLAADGTKLDGIEASADVTDTANVTAAGAVMDSELTSEASVKALNQGVATTDSPAFAGLTVDTDTLYVDSTNNRVGIGTTSPSRTLHLKEAVPAIRLEDTDVSGVYHEIISEANTGYCIRVDEGNVASGSYFRVDIDNSEKMRIDSSGNVGIGTTSPDEALEVNGDAKVSGADSGNAGVLHFGGVSDDVKIAGFDRNSGTANSMLFYTNTAERMRIDSSGNVGIGTASPTAKVTVSGTGVGAAIDWTNTTASTGRSYRWVSLNNGTGFALEDLTAGSERMRIDSSGAMIVGKTSSTTGIQGSVLHSNGSLYSSIPSGNTYHVYNTTNNNFTFYVGYTGGVINYQANNVNLSDEREKKNIEPLESKWDSVKSWSLKTFHYNHQADESIKNYGVIAQDVEQTNPEAIDVYQKDENTERKGVKEQQMMWMAIKALQEAQTRIETLETRIAALEE